MMFIFAYALTDKFNREHRELKELTGTLEQKVAERTQQLQEANQQKTQFFINLAHETKTLLTVIANYIDEYIQTHGETSELHIIQQNIEKLKTNMVNFLDHEKLERGQIFYNHHQFVNASRLVSTQALLFKELAR
jgi:signal transduction histidine kinase